MVINKIDGGLFKKMFISSANNLENKKTIVNDMNVFPVPDGDTGTNMSLTLTVAVEDIINVNSLNISEVSDIIAGASLRGARGNSGVILSQFFRGIAKYLKGKEYANTNDLAGALKEAIDTAYRAVMKPTEGTILTVAREFANKVMEVSRKNNDILYILDVSIAYAKSILAKTPEMLFVLKQAGVVDAGGQGLIFILEGAFEALKTGKVIERSDGLDVSSRIKEKPNVLKDTDTIKYTYCTEFLIQKNEKPFISEFFQEEISKYGDSIIIIDDEQFVKVHIHTNNPGIVIELGLKQGFLEDIKIDNMKMQHSHKYIKEENYKKMENKKYGLISVGAGKGIKNIFNDLGVDIIIEGGQTMNPSTHEILDAINNMYADNIFLFPNNKNIILAAEQAKLMTDKNVTILPTKNVLQAIACLLKFDYNNDNDSNIKNMQKALDNIKTGSITYAVRDSVVSGKKIKKGDILGIINDDISIVSDNISDVCFNLLETLTDEESEIITLFYGEDIKEKEATQLFKDIEEKYPDCDVEIHNGSQPLYYYIISVE